MIGCSDGVTAEIGGDVLAGATGTVTVQTCLDEDCREQEFEAEAAREGLLTAVEREGLDHGNGPDCPPVCAVGGVTLGRPPG